MVALYLYARWRAPCRRPDGGGPGAGNFAQLGHARRHLLLGRGVRLGQEDHGEHGTHHSDSSGHEQGQVHAVHEGSVDRAEQGSRVELLGHRHPAENALARRRGRRRRQSRQVETAEVASAQHAAEDSDAERAPVLLTACSTAAPTPLFSSDSSTSAADMAVAMAMPVPIPATTIHDPTNRPLEPTLVRAPEKQPGGQQDEAGGNGHLGPHYLDHPGGRDGPDDEPSDEGQETYARAHGSGGEHALEVLGHGEEDPEHGQDRHHG